MPILYEEYLTGYERDLMIEEKSLLSFSAKTDLLLDIVEATYEANLKLAEAKVLQENGTYEDLLMLYEAAAEEADEKRNGIFGTIMNAIHKLIEKIKGLFKKTKASFEGWVEANPNGKVSVRGDTANISNLEKGGFLAALLAFNSKNAIQNSTEKAASDIYENIQKLMKSINEKSGETVQLTRRELKTLRDKLEGWYDNLESISNIMDIASGRATQQNESTRIIDNYAMQIYNEMAEILMEKSAPNGPAPNVEVKFWDVNADGKRSTQLGSTFSVPRGQVIPAGNVPAAPTSAPTGKKFVGWIVNTKPVAIAQFQNGTVKADTANPSHNTLNIYADYEDVNGTNKNINDNYARAVKDFLQYLLQLDTQYQQYVDETQKGSDTSKTTYTKIADLYNKTRSAYQSLKSNSIYGFNVNHLWDPKIVPQNLIDEAGDRKKHPKRIDALIKEFELDKNTPPENLKIFQLHSDENLNKVTNNLKDNAAGKKGPFGIILSAVKYVLSVVHHALVTILHIAGIATEDDVANAKENKAAKSEELHTAIHGKDDSEEKSDKEGEDDLQNDKIVRNASEKITKAIAERDKLNDLISSFTEQKNALPDSDADKEKLQNHIDELIGKRDELSKAIKEKNVEILDHLADDAGKSADAALDDIKDTKSAKEGILKKLFNKFRGK